GGSVHDGEAENTHADQDEHRLNQPTNNEARHTVTSRTSARAGHDAERPLPESWARRGLPVAPRPRTENSIQRPVRTSIGVSGRRGTSSSRLEAARSDTRGDTTRGPSVALAAGIGARHQGQRPCDSGGAASARPREIR